MNEKDVKKVIELQGKIIKLRERIMKDVDRHNEMLMQELRPLTTDLLHNTIYQVGDMTYKRGRVFEQLDCRNYGTGIKVDGLATLRRIVVENTDAPSSDSQG